MVVGSIRITRRIKKKYFVDIQVVVPKLTEKCTNATIPEPSCDTCSRLREIFKIGENPIQQLLC